MDSATDKMTKKSRQLHSGETVHFNNSVMKENQIAYDVILSRITESCLEPCHHTSDTLCDPRWRREEHAHDIVCSPQGSSPFLGEQLPTPRGQHALILVQWKRDHTCLGSKPSFLSKHLQLGPCLDSQMTSPWPPRPVAQENSHASHPVGHGIVLNTHKISPVVAYYHKEAKCINDSTRLTWAFW